MINGQEILNSLKEKRATIENERPKIEAEFERINRKKADLESRLSAIDIVIKEFGGANSSTENQTEPISSQPSDELNEDVAPTTDFELKPKENGHNGGDKRPYGLKQVARLRLSEVSNEFTKHDIVKVLLNSNENLTEINDNTLSGVMRDLVDKGVARIKTPASGTTPQIYEKV